MPRMKEEDVHFEVPIPDCDIKALMSRKYKWRKDWAYCQSLEMLIAQEGIGKVLNLCCGYSSFGDVRADLDREVAPHVVCDMRRLPFKSQSFDTVIADPPYRFYNRPGFLMQLFDIARKRVIVDDLPIDLKPGKNWTRRWAVLTRDSGFIVKFAAVYDRKNGNLSDYS